MILQSMRLGRGRAFPVDIDNGTAFYGSDVRICQFPGADFAFDDGLVRGVEFDRLPKIIAKTRSTKERRPLIR